jgi:hypothetical protein
MRLRPAVTWSRQGLACSRGGAIGGILLAVVLLSLIPPYGLLSENEENYFALAERFVAGSAWPQKTAVFDASPHRALSDGTLGALVSAIGYTPAQIVARLLTVAGYALVLPPLFSVLALSALDAAVVVMGMALLGQDIVGGEWLFSGYEAKVAAYILVLWALRLVLEERLTAATLLFVGATYFHFLVGGFWFTAAMALRLIDAPRNLRSAARAVAAYAILVAPLCGLIAWSRLADHSAALARDAPPPDVIYSIIREPHHQSPFLSWPYFRDHWLPGYVMATPMLFGCIWLARNGAPRRLRVVALWLGSLLAYLFLVLVPKFLDRDSGALGKFYLFRSASLIEFLWLMLILAAAVQIAGKHARLLRTVLLATVAPMFVYVQGGRLMREIDASRAAEGQKAILAAAVTRLTAPGDVVLVDPEVESQWLDFERRSGRPTWVMWKFAPTNDAELIKWYRRIEVRKAVFDQGCAADIGIARPLFLLTTPATASRLAASCGPEVFRGGLWVLVARNR